LFASKKRLLIKKKNFPFCWKYVLPAKKKVCKSVRGEFLFGGTKNTKREKYREVAQKEKKKKTFYFDKK